MPKVIYTTNAGSLAAKKRALAGQVSQNMRRAAQTQAAKMKFVAISLSSGPLSTAQLRQMGHPYSRRFPAGAAGLPDHVINRQTGAFASAWSCRARRNRDDWTISLYNSSPYAAYLEFGTVTSRARPIMEEVLRKTGPVMATEVKAVMGKAVIANGRGAPVTGSAFGGFLYAAAVGVSSAAGAIEGAF